MADISNKRILTNQPITDAMGQYNFENNVLTGKPLGQFGLDSETADLYTKFSYDNNIDSPSRMYIYKGSSVEITNMHVTAGDHETDGGRFEYVKYAIYFYDSDSDKNILTDTCMTNNHWQDGKYIRSFLGAGDSFSQNGYRINFLRVGEQTQEESFFGSNTTPDPGDIVDPNNDCACYDCTSVSWDLGLPIKVDNIPKDPSIGDGASYLGEYDDMGNNTGFDTDMTNWTSELLPNDNEASGYYSFVLRSGADERETIWPAGTKTDERHRRYSIVSFPKKILYSLWRDKTNSSTLVPGEISICMHDGSDLGEAYCDDAFLVSIGYEGSDYIIDGSEDYNTTISYGDNVTAKLYSRWNLSDEYGHLNGHNQMGDHSEAINSWRAIRFRIKAPTWNQSLANQDFNSGWVDVTQNLNHWWVLGKQSERGIRPDKNMDYEGWADGWYGINNYWVNNITDWRPVATTYTHYEGLENNNKDLQNYYEPGFEDSILASAPNNIRMELNATPYPETSTGFNQTISTLTTPYTRNSQIISHYWFVVDWDWNETKPGGGECEQEGADFNCIDELFANFPGTVEELEYKQREDNLYKLAKIVSDDNLATDTDILSGMNTALSHNYQEPGSYVIKAIAFDTMDSGNWRQAINWKLVTSRVNLTSDKASDNDFQDIGGADFTFLPYNNQKIYDSTDNSPIIQTTSDIVSANGNYFRSHHPVISGLSTDSVYFKSLKKIRETASNLFGDKESSDVILMEKSYQNTPEGSINEYGRYVGPMDIAQLRFLYNSIASCKSNSVTCDSFDGITKESCEEIDTCIFTPKKYFDMSEQLGINTEVSLNNYKYYYDSYWDGESNSFPKESLIGDIFIDGYNYFFDNCLFEFNFSAEEKDVTSFKDTSGNGNKCIMFGDYSINKKTKNNPVTRESKIDLPKNSNKNGAF